MLVLGILFVIGGINNIRSAKNKGYMGLSGWIWKKLYGESFTRGIFYFQGVVFVILGLIIIFYALDV